MASCPERLPISAFAPQSAAAFAGLDAGQESAFWSLARKREAAWARAGEEVLLFGDRSGPRGHKGSGSASPLRDSALTASIPATQARLNLILSGLSQDEAGELSANLNRALIQIPAVFKGPLQTESRCPMPLASMRGMGGGKERGRASHENTGG